MVPIITHFKAHPDDPEFTKLRNPLDLADVKEGIVLLDHRRDRAGTDIFSFKGKGVRISGREFQVFHEGQIQTVTTMLRRFWIKSCVTFPRGLKGTDVVTRYQVLGKDEWTDAPKTMKVRNIISFAQIGRISIPEESGGGVTLIFPRSGKEPLPVRIGAIEVENGPIYTPKPQRGLELSS